MDSLVSMPLAAYRLGLLSRSIGVWHDNFWTIVGAESLDGVLLCFEQIQEALYVLVSDIPVDLYRQLENHLKSQHAHWLTQGNSMLSVLNRPWPEGQMWREAPDLTEFRAELRDPGRDLRAVVNQCEEYLKKQTCWFRLGCAIGRYQVICQKEDYVSPNEIRPVIDALCSLPKKPARTIPVLRRMLDSSRSRVRSPRTFLLKALKSEELAKDQKTFKTDGYVIGKMLTALDARIQKGLGEFVSACPTPRWYKMKEKQWIGELRLGKHIIRRVREGAKNVIWVLDCCQEDRWKQLSASPFPAGSKRLHETIESINEGLEFIEFHADGTGKGIVWNWKPLHR